VGRLRELNSARVEVCHELAGIGMGRISEGYGVTPVSLMPKGQTKG